MLIVDYSSNTYTGSNAGISNNYFQAYYSNTSYDRVIYSNIERFQITGTFLNDTIYTGYGNDTVTAGAGSDETVALTLTTGTGYSIGTTTPVRRICLFREFSG